MVAIAQAEQKVLDLIPGSDKVLLGFSIRSFLVTESESRSRSRSLSPIDGNRFAPITWNLKHNWRNMTVLLGTPLPNP